MKTGYSFTNVWRSFAALIRMPQQPDRLQQKLNNLQEQLKITMQQQLDPLQHKLDHLQVQFDGFSGAPPRGAVYVGNNRVLVRYMVENRLIGYLVEADDLLLAPWFILSGQFETDVTRFFVENLKSDSRCLDIGANFGFYTCLMARFCPDGKVIGIEPAHAVYELLRDNIFINGLHFYTAARHAAVSDTAGTLTLHRRATRSGNTSVSEMPKDFLEYLGEPPGESFEVSCTRLDDLLPEFDNRIDFIKIDVEGAEPLVLRGAAQTIAANPQLNIIMEWSPGQISHAGFDVSEFIREIESLGLDAAMIGASGVVSVPLSGLININYAAGILLRCGRQP